MAEKQFVDGLRVFKPRNAPSWVIANCKVKVSDLIKFMAIHSVDDELAFDIKEGKSGSFYAELNSYAKETSLTQEESNIIENAKKPEVEEENPNAGIPF